MIPDTSTLPSRIQAAVERWLSNLGIKRPHSLPRPTIAVIVADGAWDAITIAFLLHRLNGRDAAGLFRPQDMGIDNVGRNLAALLHRGLVQRNILVVADQEAYELNDA